MVSVGEGDADDDGDGDDNADSGMAVVVMVIELRFRPPGILGPAGSGSRGLAPEAECLCAAASDLIFRNKERGRNCVVPGLIFFGWESSDHE